MTRPIEPKRLGPPLDLTPEELDQATEVTPVDVAAARALWMHAPAPLAGLLDAQPEDGGN